MTDLLTKSYQILGVSVDVDETSLKRVYRSLLKKYHPDVNKDPNGTEITKRIIAAYEEVMASIEGSSVSSSRYKPAPFVSKDMTFTFDAFGEQIEFSMDVSFLERMFIRDAIQPLAQKLAKENFFEDHFDELYQSAYVVNSEKFELQQLDNSSQDRGEQQLVLQEEVLFEHDVIAMIARLYLTNPSAPITESQLHMIKELDLSNQDIGSLEDLKWFTQLEVLDLSITPIESIDSLNEMVHLKELYLSGCQSLSVEMIQGLNHIELLDLAGNEISSLDSLVKYSSLLSLMLYDNNIVDLTKISELSQLSRLDISLNPVQDITPLIQLTKLEYINLNWTRVGDFSPLLDIPSLNFVDVSYMSDAVLARNAEVWEILRQREVFVKTDLD